MKHAYPLHLTERHSRLVRLAPDEVAHLLTYHRAHIDLAPTTRRNAWRMTVRGVAGVLFTPRRRIVIAPKLAPENLLRLADPNTTSISGHDRGQVTDGDAMLDLLGGLLANHMLDRARAGLHRAYREASTQGSYLVGSLDMGAQLRLSPGRKDRLHGRHDDLTAELPCHQVPRRLAGLLLPLVNSAKGPLEQAISAFSDISDGPLTPDLLAGLDAPGVPADYLPLLDLCRLLADSLAPTSEGGTTPGPGLLVSLERLFERHVTRGIVEAFGEGDFTARSQPTHRIIGPPVLLIRPDVVIERDGRACVVVDAKWKRPPREALFNDDVYQILAYCTILGCRGAVLVYPGRRKTWRHHFEQAGVEIEVRTLDVAGPWAECVERQKRLGRSVQRLAMVE